MFRDLATTSYARPVRSRHTVSKSGGKQFSHFNASAMREYGSNPVLAHTLRSHRMDPTQGVRRYNFPCRFRIRG